MKSMIITIVTMISLLSLNCFAENIATCEKPISGDPSFKVYIYVDQDAQTKADVWQKVDFNHPISLKGNCQLADNNSPNAKYIPEGNKLLFECVGTFGSTGRMHSLLFLNKSGKKEVRFYLTQSSNAQVYVSSEILCD